MINRYKSKEGGTMIPLRFQNGGSNLFLRMPDGGTVGPMGPSPMGLPEYQTGANLGGVNEKTMQDFDHYYSQGFPMMQEGGDADMDEEDQNFYTNRMNTFIQKIRDAAEKNLSKEVMRGSQGENNEQEYTGEEMMHAAYGMNVNQRPDYGNSLYDPGNLDMFANNRIGNVKDAFKNFGQRTALIDKETAYNKKHGIPDTYTDIKSRFKPGMADIFKQKNPVYDNYTYGEMAYGGGLDEYQGDKNSSTTANNTGTGVATDDKQNGFTTKMINGKLYAIGPDGRLFSAAEGQKEEGTRFDYRNRNRLTPEFAQAMQKGTYLDSKLLGPPIIEEKGFGPFKRNVTTWQYGKLSGDPYAPNNNPTPTPRTVVPGSSKSSPDPNDPRIVSPAVKAAEDYTFRPGQGGFAPSGGWQDYPGTMEIDQAGPRDADGNPAAGPFESQYIPGSPEYPNVPGVPGAGNVGPKPTTVLSQSQPQPQPNVDPSGNQLPPGYTWDAGLNTAVMTSSANTGTNSPKGTASASSSSNPDDWRNYKPAGLTSYGKNDVSSYWDNIKQGEDFQTPSKNVTADEAKEKQKIIDQTSKLPKALQMQVRDAVFNTSMDPRLDLMYAAGVQGADGMFLGHKKTGVDAKGNPIQVSDPSLRVALRDNKAEIDKLWNDPKTQALVTQQYNDDPEAFTSSFGDQRKVSYSRLERNNGNINKRYPGWAARVDNVTNNWDTFDNVPSNQINDSYNALILDNERRYGTTIPNWKQGGTILPMFQGMVGPSTFTDMAEEEEDGVIIDPTTGQPLESKIFSPTTDQDRINNLDAGTEYNKKNDANTWFTENEFNVKQTSRQKKKPSFDKMMRNMSAATAFFNQDERLANKRKLSEASQASNVFKDAPSFYGNDIINSGKRVIGDGSGISVYNTGYAQMGGSMMENLKEGDEVYLTEDQINNILKRGGKLSYL